MTTNLSFDLIDGTFKPSEAKRILFTLIKDKINFHELELFSAYERFGEELPHSKKRIKELKAALQTIEQIIDELEQKNVDIKISGAIELTAVVKMEKNEVF